MGIRQNVSDFFLMFYLFTSADNIFFVLDPLWWLGSCVFRYILLLFGILFSKKNPGKNSKLCFLLETGNVSQICASKLWCREMLLHKKFRKPCFFLRTWCVCVYVTNIYGARWKKNFICEKKTLHKVDLQHNSQHNIFT